MLVAILVIAGIGFVAAVALVTAGLVSLAFMGFSGLVKLPY